MRIGVTGLGSMVPGGSSVSELMGNLWAHRSAIAGSQAMPDYGLAALACGRCPETFEVPGVAAHQLSAIDRTSQLSLSAAFQALAQAEQAGPLRRESLPMIWACGPGGLTTLEEGYMDVLVRGKRRMRPMTVPNTMPSAPAFHVAHHLGVRGPSLTLSMACASSAVAIMQACRLIRSGEADAVLVGGVDSMLSPVVLRGWQMAQAVATLDLENPAESCRPFSADRRGFAMAEGSAAMLLESEEHAHARGADVLGWVRGYGHTTDAAHIARPDTDAQMAALRAALQHAKASERDIVYLNAHGTATTAGDPSEAEAIWRVFGELNPRLPVSSSKALHGHTISAAGVLEALVTLESLRAGLAPGNPFLTAVDPALAPICLPRDAIKLPSPGSRLGVSNSFAFGGVNAVLVLEASND